MTINVVQNDQLRDLARMAHQAPEFASFRFTHSPSKYVQFCLLAKNCTTVLCAMVVSAAILGSETYRASYSHR